MTLEEVIQQRGSVVSLAEALGVTRQAVYMWLSKKQVPNRGTIEKLREITDGEFDVSCLY